MARKKPAKRVQKRGSIISEEFSQWNFVLFLTLSFILLVIVAVSMKDMSLDLRSRAAGRICPKISQLPRPEDCPGGSWRFQRDSNGCPTFICSPGTLPGKSGEAPGRQN